MIYSAEVAARCASIGARLLDLTDPNWYDHIDTDTLEMSRGCNCILGQLYPSIDAGYSDILIDRFGNPKWLDTVAALEEEHRDLFNLLFDEEDVWPDNFLGFDVPYEESEHGADDDIPNQARRYARLRYAWIVEIMSRRN